MTITSTVNISAGAGKTATNAYCKMTPYMNTVAVDGKVPCDLSFYYSEADKDAGADKIYPLDSNGNKVTNVLLEVQGSDIVKVGANCTMDDVFAFFYTKCAEKLTELYGWTITV